MTVLKRYVLRLFISLKYITANVVDRNNGRIVANASTVEHDLKSTLECGRTCNAKAAVAVGEVLAMRLRVEGPEQGQGRGIYINADKEIEKKGFKNRMKVWAIVNAMKNNGVKLILEDNNSVGLDSCYRGRRGDQWVYIFRLFSIRDEMSRCYRVLEPHHSSRVADSYGMSYSITSSSFLKQLYLYSSFLTGALSCVTAQSFIDHPKVKYLPISYPLFPLSPLLAQNMNQRRYLSSQLKLGNCLFGCSLWKQLEL